MHDRRLSLSLSVVVAAALMSFAPPAEAGQGSVPNPPPAMRPGQTNTVHEIGASLNGAFNPDAFIPAFNWRFHLPNTGRIGPLSGLFMGAWISMMSTRATQVSYFEEAIQRRISLENSRQFSWLTL